MELQDLSGYHILSGVDYGQRMVETWKTHVEEASSISFILDDVCYTAVEDPEDSYRSSMKELLIESTSLVMNRFKPVSVFCMYLFEHTAWGSHSLCDLISIVNVENGEEILRVGTTDTDDYYPCFTDDYNPEAMGEVK